MKPEEEKALIVSELKSFLNGSGDGWEFDDLINTAFSDRTVREVIEQLMAIQNDHPSKLEDSFCDEVGMAKIRELVVSLGGT